MLCAFSKTTVVTSPLASINSVAKGFWSSFPYTPWISAYGKDLRSSKSVCGYFHNSHDIIAPGHILPVGWWSSSKIDDVSPLQLQIVHLDTVKSSQQEGSLQLNSSLMFLSQGTTILGFQCLLWVWAVLVFLIIICSAHPALFQLP